MQQNLLYPETLLVTPPPDIKIYPQLISEDEEKSILVEIEKLELRPIHLNGVITRRRIFALSDEAPLPLFLEPLLPRAAKIMHVKPEAIAEVQITHYPHGAGIGWHHDSDIFGEILAGVTLMSGCVMRFRHEIGSQYEIFKTELPRLAAYVMSGEARWDWQHTIASHQTPRMSITFRTRAPIQ